MLGWRLAWAFSAPLLYLFFLVPFGAFLTPALQRFTAGFTDVGLSVLGIPYVMDRFTIEIPEGTFYVAEACAGLRFLIASIAFGVLYACLIYRSPWRRAAFILASCIVPVIANGFRALGIVVLGHVLGSAEAAAADHIIYGWVFFSVVILLLILAGLPFREDTATMLRRLRAGAAADRAGTQPAGLVAALARRRAVAAAMALGPAMAAAIDRAGARARPPSRCRPSSPARAAPRCPAAPPGVQHFVCDGLPLTATVRAFPPRANPGALIARRGAARRRGSGRGRATTSPARRRAGAWRLAETEKPDRSTASAAVDRRRAGAGGLARAAAPGPQRPVRRRLRAGADGGAASTAHDGPMPRRAPAGAGRSSRDFLDAQGDLQAVAVALARAAAAAQ